MLSNKSCPKYQPLDLPWKNFVRESIETIENTTNKKLSRLSFKGDEAKEAYESIINSDEITVRKNYLNLRQNIAQKKVPVNDTGSKSTAVDNNKPAIKPNASVNSILKAVEHNDIDVLQKLLTQENVNLTDCFGWTPLMSAAYCGHLEIAKLLLSFGANKRVKEKSGLTAAQLALKKNHLNIVALLRRDNRRKESSTKEQKSDEESEESAASGKSADFDKFYCDICKAEFTETTVKKHEASTLHIFNTKPKLKSAVYQISKQNKGYQILVNSGWDEENGLGPEGKGNKYPVKTLLKRDRVGFGKEADKELRVTHFRPNDTKAIESVRKSSRSMTKKSREKLLKTEARKERALRIALS